MLFHIGDGNRLVIGVREIDSKDFFFLYLERKLVDAP